MKPKSSQIHVRLQPEVKQAFAAKAEPLGTMSDVLREMVLGYIDGRVTIKPRPLI